MKTGNLNIGISEYGDPAGIPVFYFHGFPGSRLDGKLFDFDQTGRGSKVRLIGIDRPGIGLSDFQQKRQLLDWPDTVTSIADHLELKKFSVLGISGGAPYALSCAYAIPERLNAVAIVSGMGPYTYKESLEGKAMHIPRQVGLLRWLIASGLRVGAVKNPDKLKESINSTLPERDKKYLSQPGKMDNLVDLFKESFRQGLKGYLYEAKLYKRDWGFKVSDIKTTVYLWHGSADKNVGIEVAKKIADEINDCESTFLENEGHFSVTGNYLKDILNVLKSKNTAYDKV